MDCIGQLNDFFCLCGAFVINAIFARRCYDTRYFVQAFITMALILEELIVADTDQRTPNQSRAYRNGDLSKERQSRLFLKRAILLNAILWQNNGLHGNKKITLTHNFKL